VVSAFKDPGTLSWPGRDLQRAEIVKGWIDAQGEGHVQVYEVASTPETGGVDLSTCEPEGSGASSLCRVWEDPDFDPAQPAWYYLRVLELPVCRWSRRDCNELAGAGVELPEACTTRPETVQERAWTSPIFYTPA
jgi:hypothetical protein